MLKNIYYLYIKFTMGAGTCEDHYIQDAAECYWVYLCQKYLASLDPPLNISSVEERKTEFTEYCSTRDIVECFDKSDYKKNMDLCVVKWVQKLIEKYPGKKMDITNVEAEYRNESKKADFIIIFEDKQIIPVSLKNYRCGYDSIQLKSGTWHSFINGFALNVAPGPGMYIDYRTGKKFKAQSKSLKRRNENYEILGFSEIVSDLEQLDIIMKEVKDKYVYNDEYKYFTGDIPVKWVNDCRDYGHRGIEIIMNALDKLPKEKIKEKLLKDTDLCHNEELLLIGKNGTMMCSLFNENYKKLLCRVNSPDCKLSYHKHSKNLRMILVDHIGEILHIDIPFTLQKNGAWHLPSNKYEGELYHSKEKKYLKFGERRPKKSKEISTSTNMWFKIKDYL